MNSLSNLKLVSGKTIPMNEIVETWLIELNEYNFDTSRFDLMEYVNYESGIYDSSDYSSIESGIHSTILSLAVM